MPVGSTGAFAATASDFERVGGVSTVRAVVERFYELVLGDDRLAGYFDGTDMRALKRHQVLLVSQAMGGPARYDGPGLHRAHAGREITPVHFGLTVTYLAAAMQWAGVPSEIIARVGARLSDAEWDVVTAGALRVHRRPV